MDTIVPILLVLNAATFVVFGVDKLLARMQRSRVPEATLLGLAWVGAPLGAWAAMSVFRHKTRKRGFRLKLAAVTLLNPAWLALWLALRG